MTTYAHDPASRTIVACWHAGDGAVAERVARVPRELDDTVARRTAGLLTGLSESLWLAYTEHEVPRLDPDELLAAVRYPGAAQRVLGDERLQLARLLGHRVSEAPGRAFRDAVVREVRAELDAVTAADAGELTGRGRQAVAHVRIDGPDTALAAAHAVLAADPLEPVELLTSVEPYAAATAAVHWLRRAAVHVADVAGHRVDDVVALAEAIAHEDLLVAREALVTRADRTAAELVRELLSEAVLAGRGVFVVCREHAPGGADDGPWHGPDDPWHGAEQGWLADDPADGTEIADETGHRVLRTVLDPLDPGRYLVDGLVRGIHGCFRVYVDETLARERPGDDRAADPGYLVRLRDRFVTGLRTAG